MDEYVLLARQAIEECLKHNRILKTTNLSPELLNNKAGVFVSLHHQSDHSLRGCIGTFLPTKNSIAEEIIANAIAAATDDPRFPPVRKHEIKDLAINVDILSKPELETDINNLDPKKYGLLVKNQAGRTGLLLPDIGIESAEEQISICCQKAGIDPNKDKLQLFRFTVERHR